MMNTAIGGPMAAPKRLAAWLTPCTKPRSSRGYHICMARVAVGNAPASPTPSEKRIPQKEEKPNARVVRKAMTVRYVMIAERTLRGPKRSPNQPPGTWNREYDQMKALKIIPIVTLLKPYSLLMSGAVLAMLTRSRYVMRYIRQRRSSTTQRTWLRPDSSSFSISMPPSPRVNGPEEFRGALRDTACPPC